MSLFTSPAGRGFGITLVSLILSLSVFAQQNTQTLQGQVLDQLGGAIVGATISVIDVNNVEKVATSNGEGFYRLTDLTPGTYKVRAAAPGFVTTEFESFVVADGRKNEYNFNLSVPGVTAEVTMIDNRSGLDTEPDKNANAVVLREDDLEPFPNDPEELASALQAIAGTSAGPNGGQLFIDGFTGGRVPPKESIREVRINQNPFSAEHDRLGFGRIEILTKAGTGQIHGEGFYNFSDESLNSRNPFAPSRAPYQMRSFGGSVSGPVIAKRASFFVDFMRRGTDDNNTVNALVVDPAFNIVRFSQAVVTPNRWGTFGPRLDYQLNQSNTLMVRYAHTASRSENDGVGGFSLPSQAYNSSNSNQSIQLMNTAVIKQRIVNETRFQFLRSHRHQGGNNNTLPTIRVLEAFTDGGAQIGQTSNEVSRWEVQNNTSWSLGAHSLKAGARLRGVTLSDLSSSNFGGTYTFSGGLAPQLDSNQQLVRDISGQVVLAPITSIERYRRTLFLQQQGLTPDEIRTLGGGATQFSLASGQPDARVGQVDFGIFVQNDWRLRPNFVLSAGLRYEGQSNINNRMNFAPRIAFAWTPEASSGFQPRTVVRGGFGVFYERFSEGLALQAVRYNGVNQQQFVTRDAAVLSMYPNVPNADMLAGFAVPSITRIVDPSLQAPYTMQSTISVERQMPAGLRLTGTFINSRTLHSLRSRNVNAPLPGSFAFGMDGNGIRPFGEVGDIYRYESTGILKQNQLIVSTNGTISQKLMLSATYTLNKAEGNADGANSFPADSYDLSGEYGRSAFDVRHRLFLRASFKAPWRMTFAPIIVASSGRPFNITTGRDSNGDGLFTERPALAADPSRPGVVSTPFGTFDPNPLSEYQVIPRNFGHAPSFFSVNLITAKTFGFGKGAPAMRQGHSGGAMSSLEKPYNLTFTIMVHNLLNNVNPEAPVGNLSSPLFGQSIGNLGSFGSGNMMSNRRINLIVRFNF